MQNIETLIKKIPILKMRSKMTNSLRQFFAKNGYFEIETPLRLPTPALEDYIEAEISGNKWLRTSPEFHMKQIIAAGVDKVFQLGACFRQGEFGTRHLSEFTMLEWYRTNTDYLGILEETKELVISLAKNVLGTTIIIYDGNEIELDCKWELLTVKEAFDLYASCSLEEAMSQNKYEEILCFEVEPNLGKGKPTVLMDYPAEMAALARRKKENPEVAERWELYLNGIELANAYSELIDPVEQRQRFILCQELRTKEQRPVYDIDEEFLAAMESGMPPCGGIAIGFDRLVMLFSGTTEIQDVVAFSYK